MPIPRGRSTDEASFERFFTESCHLVVGLVAVTTGDIPGAEDAVQEAYVRAHRRWERVATMDRPDLWVAHVATRVAISSWRRRRRETTLDAAVAAEVSDSVTRLWARWGLEALSPNQRLAVVLHHIHGLPVDEVAAESGSSKETVRTHLKRGRQRLRQLLSEETGYE
jgi:RNA polymerase sigma-70 factor, ECF subfamily